MNDILEKAIRCLVFQDKDNDEWEWSAVALELDVWGFGNTVKEAKDDLSEMIATQIEFATGRGELEILDHPTEKQWFDLWEKLENDSSDEKHETQEKPHRFLNQNYSIAA